MILIIEDDSIFRMILSSKIKSYFGDKYEIFEFSKIQEAHEFIIKNEDQIKLIFSDLQLDDSTKIETIEYYYKHNINKKIPIVLITADTQEEVKDLMREALYKNYIDFHNKTNLISEDRLCNTINRWAIN